GPSAQPHGSQVCGKPKPVQAWRTTAPRKSGQLIAPVKKGECRGNCCKDNEESGRRGRPLGKKVGEETGLTGERRPVKGQRSPSQFSRQNDGEDDDARKKTIGEALRQSPQ